MEELLSHILNMHGFSQNLTPVLLPDVNTYVSVYVSLGKAKLRAIKVGKELNNFIKE
jgi:hypothetical protein